MKEENNPWNPPNKEASIDLLGVWRWFKGRSRGKLRARLKASRMRYRRALGYKEPEIDDELDRDKV